MKKLSVKMKITLWYTGLIVIILSAIFTAVLLATDKVLLLGVQNKLEEEVYDFAEELKVDSNGRLRLEKLDFLKDGVRLAVYHENGQMITGLVASGLPETPFADELLQKAGSDQQNWFVYDFYFKPRHADNFYWVRGTVPLSSAYAERDKILRQCALFFPLLILLAALGGYEVATMVGAVLQAAQERRVILVDGFITSAAVLVASRLQPHVLQRCVFAHRSGERGHQLMLAQMQAEPLLDLGLRLGEGSGAALAWPLLPSACAILREMASFEAAGVSEQTAAA